MPHNPVVRTSIATGGATTSKAKAEKVGLRGSHSAKPSNMFFRCAVRYVGGTPWASCSCHSSCAVYVASCSHAPLGSNVGLKIRKQKTASCFVRGECGDPTSGMSSLC